MDITKLSDADLQVMADTAWSAWSMAQAVAHVYPDRRRSAKKMSARSLDEANWLDEEIKRRGDTNK